MTSDFVLFVDDEQNILNAVKRLFISDPISVLTATSALEGMELMKNNIVSVIVSDNMMPGMSGMDFLTLTNIVSPNSVRILMTGYEDLPAAIEAINNGEVFRFVTKPWDEMELRQTVLDSVAKYKIVSSIKSADEAKLLSLAQTIELKDPYTKGHCERVARYAQMLTDAMNLPDAMKNNIKYGSWLHDCGKIGIPETILNKPDAMTSDRPYRKKLLAKEAMYVLKEGESASFDPDLVDIFIRVLSDVIYNNEHVR